MEMVEGANAHFLYYYTSEGKNESDSWGSIVKLSYNRAIHYTEGANRSVPEIAKMIKENLADHGKKWEFMEVHVVEPFEREKNPKGIPLKGIQQSHHMTCTEDGNLISRDLACIECITTQGLCNICKLIKPFHSTLGEMGEDAEIEKLCNNEEDYENETPIDDEDYTDHENDEDEEDIEEDESEPIGAGTVVWARIRSWYPAEVCCLEDIPLTFKKLIPDHPSDEVFIKRFPPFGDVRLVKLTYIQGLGENKLDKVRAMKSETILEAYNNALAKQFGDI